MLLGSFLREQSGQALISLYAPGAIFKLLREPDRYLYKQYALLCVTAPVLELLDIGGFYL